MAKTTTQGIIDTLEHENFELMRMVLEARGVDIEAPAALADLIGEVRDRASAREAAAQEAARQARGAWTPASV